MHIMHDYHMSNASVTNNMIDMFAIGNQLAEQTAKLYIRITNC